MLLVAPGCGFTPFHVEPQPSAVAVPDAAEFTWHGFKVRLEPTVMLWERDARIDLRSVVRGALKRIERDLKGSPASITVQAGSYRTIPDVGIGGSTNQITGEVGITMDQRSPVGLRRMLTVWLPLALAHELHHSARIIDGPGYGATLLEAVVTEGSAEAFVREAFPRAPSIPWVRPLTTQQERYVWRRLNDQGDEPDAGRLHDQWFYGDDGLPRWAGYRIGYHIARTYLRRHPETSAAELVSLSAGRILEGSGLDPGTLGAGTTESAHG